MLVFGNVAALQKGIDLLAKVFHQRAVRHARCLAEWITGQNILRVGNHIVIDKTRWTNAEFG